jgi:hypothetical protein
MKANNEKKRALLGIPYGTANARLKKALLFSLAKRLGLTYCYRCGAVIETIDDFSIEHKKAWASAVDPIAAFYDIDNIAFSHLICNISAATRPNKIYNDSKEQKRVAAARFYSIPENRERHLRKKREAYHKRKSELD